MNWKIWNIFTPATARKESAMPDGGTVWHHVVADPNGNPIRLALRGLTLKNQSLQVRRSGATDLTGVWASAW